MLDFDGTVISGTTEQFKTQEYSGFDTFVSHVIGEMETLVACAGTAAITKSDGLTNYVLTLDADKLAAMTEELTALKEEGIPVKDATILSPLTRTKTFARWNCRLASMAMVLQSVWNSQTSTTRKSILSLRQPWYTRRRRRSCRCGPTSFFKGLDAYVSTPSDQSSSDTTSAK